MDCIFKYFLVKDVLNKFQIIFNKMYMVYSMVNILKIKFPRMKFAKTRIMLDLFNN